MAKIVAITSSPTGIVHTFMAAEALQRGAEALGHTIKVETQGSGEAQHTLTTDDIQTADVVIIAADEKVAQDRFSAKPVYETTTSKAIRQSQQIIEEALAQQAASSDTSSPAAQTTPATPVAPKEVEHARIVAITSCPTGIAHTFMAAEALERAAETLGHQIKVETQGSVGAQNALTPEEIQRANVVVIAADAKVDQSRFTGKTVYETSTHDALQNGPGVLNKALALAARNPQGTATASTTGSSSQDYLAQIQDAKSKRSAASTGVYKHLMTGVSYMLPFVVAGGLLIAISFAIGGIDAAKHAGTLGWALNQIGAGTGAFSLIVPILAGYISYSIADRPGLAPGMIGGVLSNSIGAGFLGGLIAGFLAGYATFYLSKWINLPKNLAGLKPVLVLPLLSTAIVGLLMVYVIGTPVSLILAALTNWLKTMQGTNALLLGLLLGGMMAIDMGGPINKSAYTFSVGLLSSHVDAPMAAVMAAGMTPPLGLALATYLFKNRFTVEEQDAGKAAAVLGIAFITEGAIPFAARDPFRVIPATMIGSAVAGALSMLFACQLQVPHGGIFVLFIPGAVTNLLSYFIAIIAGTLVTTGILFFTKRSLTSKTATVKAEAQLAQAS
ncbi:PTS fructose-like transporter subunit IIB [Dictyobacter aurantiacus]|uniref:PTS fructose transporter subunit IIBC n=1 Tax=Dictyobacter aurantiacus TaxID=1936993 RepID=A0A401ZQ14_9CHLR|nr:PTS fructose-like transporter subunit IIB [Dictyobacter aurantiacus]GCE08998.1 PTS fructose transporter subunit IIBC [Dictyobacter aurantiacus]